MYFTGVRLPNLVRFKSGRLRWLSITYWIAGLLILAFLGAARLFSASTVPTQVQGILLFIGASLIVIPVFVPFVVSWVRSVSRSVDNDAAQIRLRLTTAGSANTEHELAKIHEELSLLREGARLGTTHIYNEFDPQKLLRLLDSHEAEGQAHALAREYGSVGLSQAKVAFGASLVAAGIGFCVIVAGAISAFFTSLSRASIPLIAGAVINGVAALFFSQSNQTRSLMRTLLTEEQSSKRFDESLTLARDIKDERVQSRLQALLSLNFAGVSEDPRLFEAIIGRRASGELPNTGDPSARQRDDPDTRSARSRKKAVMPGPRSVAKRSPTS